MEALLQQCEINAIQATLEKRSICSRQELRSTSHKKSELGMLHSIQKNPVSLCAARFTVRRLYLCTVADEFSYRQDQMRRQGSVQEVLHRATVLCADDDASVISRVCTVLSDTYNIVATASDGAEALEQSLQLRPDFVILDISMPRMDGLMVARHIRKSEHPSKIIFLTLIQDDDYISIARKIGDGYVLKKKLTNDLVPAIQSASRGEFYCSIWDSKS